jgi:hypothetical protein
MKIPPCPLRAGFPSISNRLLSPALAAALGLTPADLASGATWIGGNGDWENASGHENWSPADEPDDGEDATFTTPHTVWLRVSSPFVLSHSIGTLNMSGGSTLNMGGEPLSVSAFVNLSGAGTRLVARGSYLGVNNGSISIGSGSTLFLDYGAIGLNSRTADRHLTISGGALVGYGNVIVDDRSDYNVDYDTTINNNGTITASNASATYFPPPYAGRLYFGNSDYGARLDLDGSLEAGVVNIEHNQTLETKIPLADAFNGNLSMAQDSKLIIDRTWLSDPDTWSLGTGGTMVIDNGATTGAGGIPAGTATIAGITFTQTGGTITVIDADGTLQIDVPYTFSGGLLNNSGRVILQKNATIAAGASFAGTGTLTIADGGEMVTEPGANANTVVDLQGSLRIGSSSTITDVAAKKLQMAPTADVHVDLIGTSSNQYDHVMVNGIAELNGTLNLHFGEVSPGVPFVPEVGQKFNILSASGGVTGTFKALATSAMSEGLTFKINYLPTAVEAEVISGDEFELWVHHFPSIASPADRLRTGDPDQDGLNNLVEFALDDDPGSSSPSGKVATRIASVNGQNVLTLTFPVRFANESYDTPGGEFLMIGLANPSLHYKAQATDNLTSFGLDVERVTGEDAAAIQAGLPILSPGWTYTTCRSAGPVIANPRTFMRLDISEGPLPP